MKEGRFEEAISEYKSALKGAHQRQKQLPIEGSELVAEAYLGLGNTFVVLNRIPEAEDAYQQAISAGGSWASEQHARYNAAVVMSLQGHNEAAANAFYDVIRLMSNAPAVKGSSELAFLSRCGLASLSMLKTDRDEAISHYVRALHELIIMVSTRDNSMGSASVRKLLQKAYYGLAMCYRDKGDYSSAIAWLTPITTMSADGSVTEGDSGVTSIVKSRAMGNMHDLLKLVDKQPKVGPLPYYGPDQGSEPTEGTITTVKTSLRLNDVCNVYTPAEVHWMTPLKNVGDVVEAEEGVLQLEMDKIMVDAGAPEAGIVTHLVSPQQWLEKTQEKPPGSDRAALTAKDHLFDILPARVAAVPESRTFDVNSSPSKSIVYGSVDEAAEWLASAKSVVALTGAGISKASNLRTRKDLWTVMSRVEYVTIWNYAKQPQKLWQLALEFLADADNDPQPNEAHRALAQLEGMGLLKGVITQNVDSLHQHAGNSNVIELHGTLARTKCSTCGTTGLSVLETWKNHIAATRKKSIQSADDVPKCAACGDRHWTSLNERQNAYMRPDVVLFGELVPADVLRHAYELTKNCDVLLVVGTASDVAPACELPALAKASGAKVIEIKRQPSRITDRLTDLFVSGTADSVLPSIVEHLKKRLSARTST
jgi:NAD-dependent deacetylase